VNLIPKFGRVTKEPTRCSPLDSPSPSSAPPSRRAPSVWPLCSHMEPSELNHHPAAANSGIDAQTGLVITVVAAQSYCPQFVHQMANGTTVVGPNH
jgi:hypothetical protein